MATTIQSLLAAALLFLGPLAASTPIGANTLMPIQGATPDAKPTSPTYLRGRHVVYLYARHAGERVGLRIEAKRVGRYTASIRSETAAGDKRYTVSLEPGQRGELSFAAPRRGLCRVVLDTRSNAATATPLNGVVALEASEAHPVHCISHVGALYFYVPKGTRSFAVWAKGQGNVENVRVRVFGPDGHLHGKCSVQGGSKGCVRIETPQNQTAKIWWFTADKPPELKGTFEDATLWLSPEVPPFVSTRAAGLLAPFCHGLVQRPRVRMDGREAIGLRLIASAPPDATFAARLSPKGSGRAICSASAPAANASVALNLPSTLRAGEYVLSAKLATADGAVLCRASSPVIVTPRILFVGGYCPLIEVRVLPLADGQRVPALSLRTNLVGLPQAANMSASLRRTNIPDPPGGPTAVEVFKRQFADTGEGRQVVKPPQNLSDGHYQWLAVMRAGGELLDWQQAHFLLQGHQVFTEVPPPASMSPAALGSDVWGRGFIVFVPDQAEAVPYNYRPSYADLSRAIAFAAAPGEFEPATVGLIAMQAEQEITVNMTPAQGPRNATIPAEAFDVRLARHWPQRVSWRARTYRVIPEMLEPCRAFDMAPFQLKQIWITLHVPAGAAAGIYHADLLLTTSGLCIRKPVEITVYPFALARPEGINWGLYSDSGRWGSYPDSQVRAELMDFDAHGITNLMMYPLDYSIVTLERGDLKIDSSKFEKYMAMALQCGLRQPTVISVQSLRYTVRKLLPGKQLEDAEFKSVYQAIAGHFVELAAKRRWGECVWHAVDEPRMNNPKRMHESAVELGYLKELGVDTFTTAGIVTDDLERVLDVRCYPPQHLLVSTEMAAREREATRKAGDRLWFYGSGCYTGQDGNVIANRRLTGYVFWKSGATGEWSWTFMRAKASVYNDFDGAGRREAKDACICYPSTNHAEPTPTLQWEGIREGIDDYAYLYTLRRAAGARWGTVKRQVNAMLDQVPWVSERKPFECRDAQRIREEIAQLIVEFQPENR